MQDMCLVDLCLVLQQYWPGYCSSRNGRGGGGWVLNLGEIGSNFQK